MPIKPAVCALLLALGCTACSRAGDGSAAGQPDAVPGGDIQAANLAESLRVMVGSLKAKIAEADEKSVHAQEESARAAKAKEEAAAGPLPVTRLLSATTGASLHIASP